MAVAQASQSPWPWLLWALLSWWAWLVTPFWPQGVVLAGLLAFLTVVDIKTQFLPDLLVLPGIALGLVLAPSFGLDLGDAALGACAGALFFAFVYMLVWRLLGKEGLGLGDVKFMALAGAWLGWNMLPTMVVLASLAAIAGMVVTRVLGRAKGSALPYGPFLACGVWVAWLHGPVLWAQWLTWRADLVQQLVGR